MNLRLQTILNSVHKKRYTVSIYDTEAVNEEVAFFASTGAGTPVIKRHAGDEFTSTLVTSSLQMNMIVDSEATHAFWNDLKTSNEGRFIITINDDYNHTYFTGIILSDLGKVKLMTPLVITFKAVDTMAQLKDEPYKYPRKQFEATTTIINNYKWYTILDHILNVVRLSLIYKKLDLLPGTPFLYVKSSWVEVQDVGVSFGVNELFAKTRLPNYFYTAEEQDNYTTYKEFNCHEVLDEILRGFNARMYQYNGGYVIEQIGARLTDDNTYKVYDFDGNYLADTVIAQLHDLDSNGNSVDAYPSIEYYPPIKAVILHQEGGSIDNLIEGLDITLNQSHTIDLPDEYSGAIVFNLVYRAMWMKDFPNDLILKLGLIIVISGENGSNVRSFYGNADNVTRVDGSINQVNGYFMGVMEGLLGGFNIEHDILAGSPNNPFSNDINNDAHSYNLSLTIPIEIGTGERLSFGFMPLNRARHRDDIYLDFLESSINIDTRVSGRNYKIEAGADNSINHDIKVSFGDYRNNTVTVGEWYGQDRRLQRACSTDLSFTGYIDTHLWKSLYQPDYTGNIQELLLREIASFRPGPTGKLDISIFGNHTVMYAQLLKYDGVIYLPKNVAFDLRNDTYKYSGALAVKTGVPAVIPPVDYDDEVVDNPITLPDLRFRFYNRSIASGRVVEIDFDFTGVIFNPEEWRVYVGGYEYTYDDRLTQSSFKINDNGDIELWRAADEVIVEVFRKSIKNWAALNVYSTDSYTVSKFPDNPYDLMKSAGEVFLLVGAVKYVLIPPDATHQQGTYKLIPNDDGTATIELWRATDEVITYSTSGFYFF